MKMLNHKVTTTFKLLFLILFLLQAKKYYFWEFKNKIKLKKNFSTETTNLYFNYYLMLDKCNSGIS